MSDNNIVDSTAATLLHPLLKVDLPSHNLPPLRQTTPKQSQHAHSHHHSYTHHRHQSLLKNAVQKTGVRASSFLPFTLRNYFWNRVSNQPQHILEHFQQQPEFNLLQEPTAIEMQGVLLFVDMHGFTPLSERLSQQGIVGVELLSRYLNAYFGPMVTRINEHGGDIIKFAGDALLVLFTHPQDDAPVPTLLSRSVSSPATSSLTDSDDLSTLVHAATYCAQQIHAEFNGFQIEDATLSIHSAISSGTVYGIIIGGYQQRWEFLLKGEPIEQLAPAMNAAKQNQIVLTESAYQYISSITTCCPLNLPTSPDCYLLCSPISAPFLPLPSLTITPLSPTSHSNSSSTAISPSRYVDDSETYIEDMKKAVEIASHGFMIKHILARIEDGQGQWLAEFRRCTTLFIKLPQHDCSNPDPSIRAYALSEFSSVVDMIWSVCSRRSGHVRQLITDDKGTVMILVFGLVSHSNNPLRGVKAALEIHSRMRTMNYDCAIGITTGSVFAGTIGNEQRCEYAVIGSSVNTAARLMAAVPDGNGLFCDEDTKQAVTTSMNHEVLFVQAPDLKLKGKSEMFACYIPSLPISRSGSISNAVSAAHKSIVESMFRPGGIVGRESEIQVITSRVQSAAEHSTAIHGPLFLEAVAGAGKSTLIRHILSSARSMGMLVLSGCGDENDSSAYHALSNVLRGLLITLLNLCELPSTKRKTDQIEDEPQTKFIFNDADQLDIPEELKTSGRLSLLNEIVKGVAFKRPPKISPTNVAYSTPFCPMSPIPASPSTISSPLVHTNQHQHRFEFLRSHSTSSLPHSPSTSSISSTSSHSPSPTPPSLLRSSLSSHSLLSHSSNSSEADTLDPQAKAEQTQQLIVDLITAAQERAPENICIAIDDAQWLDSTSVAVLNTIIRVLPSILLIIGSRTFASDSVCTPLLKSCPDLEVFTTQQPTISTDENNAVVKDEIISPVEYDSESCTSQESSEEEQDENVVNNSLLIHLSQLSTSDIAHLIRLRLDVLHVDDNVAEFIQSKAAGHVLFAEQLLMCLLNMKTVEVQVGRCKFVDSAVNSLDSLQFPDSLTDVIATRIDSLSPSQQLLLKVCSVFGGEIIGECILHVLYHHDLSSSRHESFTIRPRHIDFDSLVHSEFLIEVEKPADQQHDTIEQIPENDGNKLPHSSPDHVCSADCPCATIERAWQREMCTMSHHVDRRFVFHHALISDVAYSRLPFSYRSAFHLSIARWYEQRYCESSKHATKLAYHWQQVCSSTSDPAIRHESALKSIHYLSIVGEQHANKYANAEAATAYQQAVDLIKIVQEREPAQSRWRELSLLEPLISCMSICNKFQGATPACHRLIQVADEVAAEQELDKQQKLKLAKYRFTATATLFISVCHSPAKKGKIKEQEQVLQQMQALAESTGSVTRLIDAHYSAQCHFYCKGDYASAIEHGKQVVKLYSRTSVRWIAMPRTIFHPATAGRASLGTCLVLSGHLHTGFSHLFTALKLAQNIVGSISFQQCHGHARLLLILAEADETGTLVSQVSDSSMKAPVSHMSTSPVFTAVRYLKEMLENPNNSSLATQHADDIWLMSQQATILSSLSAGPQCAIYLLARQYERGLVLTSSWIQHADDGEEEANTFSECYRYRAEFFKMKIQHIMQQQRQQSRLNNTAAPVDFLDSSASHIDISTDTSPSSLLTQSVSCFARSVCIASSQGVVVLEVKTLLGLLRLHAEFPSAAQCVPQCSTISHYYSTDDQIIQRLLSLYNLRFRTVEGVKNDTRWMEMKWRRELEVIVQQQKEVTENN